MTSEPVSAEDRSNAQLGGWVEVPKEFNDWWDRDALTQTNPFDDDSPAFWAWEGWQACKAAMPQPAERVPVPTTADQAAGMVLIGTAWLEENAPERLRAKPLNV